MARGRLLSLAGALDGHGDRYSMPVVSELSGLLIGGLSTSSSFCIPSSEGTGRPQRGC